MHQNREIYKLYKRVKGLKNETESAAQAPQIGTTAKNAR
jgi:hypothetical protein